MLNKKPTYALTLSYSTIFIQYLAQSIDYYIINKKKMSFRKAFQPCVLTLRGAGTERAFELRNRIAMAPMTRRKVPLEAEGVPTKQMETYYERRAKGEVGLIISEGVHIDNTHSIDNPCTPRIHNVAQVSRRISTH